MLTRERAIEFLQNSWNIKDVELQLRTDRKGFLNKLIVTMHEKVPFHVFFAYMPAEWKMQNFAELDEMCMSGFGGHCGAINTFVYRLLTVLGFAAQIGFAAVTTTRHGTHVIVIVEDLVNTGDIHLVDCGLGQPSFTAISLNFDEESPVFQESYLEYKFIKRDGKILRMHGSGDLMKHNNPPKEGLDFILGKWRRYFSFTLPLKGLEFITSFEEYRNNVLDLRPAIYLFSPRAAIFPSGKASMIMGGNTLFIEEEDKTLKQTTLKYFEEIFEAYEEYFPTIDKNLVQLAYSKWQKISKL